MFELEYGTINYRTAKDGKAERYVKVIIKKYIDEKAFRAHLKHLERLKRANKIAFVKYVERQEPVERERG